MFFHKTLTLSGPWQPATVAESRMYNRSGLCPPASGGNSEVQEGWVTVTQLRECGGTSPLEPEVLT